MDRSPNTGIMTTAVATRSTHGFSLQPDVSGADNDQALVHLWLVSKAPSTQLEYRREVRSLLELGPLRELTLQGLVRWMQDGPRTLGVAARNRRTAAAKSLLTFGHRTGYLAANVGSAIRLQAAPRPLHRRIVDREVMARLLQEARPGREAALVRTAYASGSRVSELAGLRWEDVQARDGAQAQITVTGKTGQRTLLVDAQTATSLRILHKQELAAGRGQQQDAVFWGKRGPLTRAGIWRIVKLLAARCGAPKGFSPHWIRHAAASHSLDAGAPVSLVQYSLGHASLTTTTAYVHARPGESLAHYLAPEPC